MSDSTTQFPQHLKRLSAESLRELAEDLRQDILSTSLRNGGHLGASLGTVELAIALHRTFESPREPIVWDVGHQAYAHKLLTGRRAEFGTLRMTGGISGFLSRAESPHDAFGAGHSSTSLSAALAMAWARKDTTDWTVAVIGDGGLTAGLALEALNNAKTLALGPLLVVLNDNQMSISPNIGALPSIFAEGGGPEFFRAFGFDYLGPVDGHDLDALLGTLEGIRQGYSGKPILLHTHTQKGKGYIPAEEQPSYYHGISPLQQKVPGHVADTLPQKTYSQAFGIALCELAAQDPRVVAITAAMSEGTGLQEFAHRFPGRFFDVGIAEQHAVTFAAGLATQGYRPVVAIYSTFLQRAFDQLIHDVAIQGLPVTFVVDRAGIVGADGPTHHGAFDGSYLSVIPGFEVHAAGSLQDVGTLLKQGVESGKPFAVRIPRGSGPATLAQPVLANGLRWMTQVAAPRALLVAVGATVARAAEAAHRSDPTTQLLDVVNVTCLKPLPEELVAYLEAHPQSPYLVVEDAAQIGGVGQRLASELALRKGEWLEAGYPDRFIPHGAPKDLEAQLNLSSPQLAERLERLLARKPHGQP